MDVEDLDGSSVLVLYSGLCNIKFLGVLPLSLDGILVYHRLPQVVVRMPSQLASTISTPWRGEVLRELSVLS